MKIMNVICILLAAMFVSACDGARDSTPSPQNNSFLLTFVEFEKEVEPYQTRLIVIPEFMRFDDGEGSVDFILFDRKKKLIYSVNSGNQTVMMLEPKTVTVKPPFKLKLDEKNLGTLDDAPAIENKQPLHYQFSVNEEVCYDVVAVAGLMQDVVDAMQSFTAVLASDSAVTFNTIPADMHNACDMAMTTFAAGRHFKYGFPVQEWSRKGAGRSLIDFKQDYRPDAALFVLPKEFQIYSIQDFRDGKVSFKE